MTCTQESDLIENVEEDKDSDITKAEEERSKVQVMYKLIESIITSYVLA